MTGRIPHETLPLAARRVLWDQVWDRLLGPSRQEPATPERIPTPEELADSQPRSRRVGRQS